MKKAFNVLLDAFDYIFDRDLIRFFFRRLMIAFMPLFVMLFLASRVKWEWGRQALATLGGLWTYVVVLLSLGVVCRAVFIKCRKKVEPDLDLCVAFSTTFAPAYIFIPTLIIIASMILKVASVAILFLGNIPYVGEVFLSILTLPIFLIGAVAAFVFTVGIFFAPAIIATEEEGVVYTFKRIISLVNYVPLKFFLYFSFTAIFALVFTAALAIIVYSVVPTITPIGNAFMGENFANYKAAVTGHMIPLENTFPAGVVPFTYHIAAFFAYISFSILFVLLFTFPGIYLSSSSTLIYNLLREEETEIKNAGASPIVGGDAAAKMAETNRRICSNCGTEVKKELKFCTSCGQKFEEPEEPEFDIEQF